MSLDLSVLIRTYNSGQTLEACLRSLSAQTLPPQQTIIVDSGSSDNTLEIARSYGAKIVHYPDEKDFNYSRALNIGMEKVRKSHTLIVSSHVSLPDPDTLRVLMRLLETEDRRCAASIPATVQSPTDVEIGEVKWTLVTQENFIPRYGGVGISNSCNLIPTELWRHCAFDESIPRCEDQKWLKYFLKRDWNAARVKRPQVVYNNPYFNVRKQISDVLALAKYDINPTLTNLSSIMGRVRNCLTALINGKTQQAVHSARIIRGLLWVRMGMDKERKSRYF